MEEIDKYTELITKIIMRLEKIWQEGEGVLSIKITDDKGKKAKLEGGETDRIG
jgi:hypothetical protein